MAIVSIRLEDQMKQELEELCDAMGMNVTTFFTIYAKKVLRDRKIPFNLEAPTIAKIAEQIAETEEKEPSNN